MVFDKGCITIAGAYHAASQAVAAAAAQTGQQASNGEGSVALSVDAQHRQYAGSNSVAAQKLGMMFMSKEATMAAVCREVAVKGFEPIPDVFSKLEW
jgi:hypothetical protein